MKITITAPSGIEGVVKKELYNLTGISCQAINGKLTFDGDIALVAKLNLYMRTASRIYINLGGFKASSFDELYDNLSKIDFENYLLKNSKFTITSSIFESKLNSLQAVSSVSKKAVYDRLEKFSNSSENSNGFIHKFEINVRRDYVTVYLNTSGESLHKRGYRKSYGEAPIKETVASALINLTYYKKAKVIADLFCGSGTIAIETAMILKNVQPGKNRDFDFLHFDKFNVDFYAETLREAIANEKDIVDCKILASDIDETQVEIAKRNAKRAGVSDLITFSVSNALDFASDFENGVIITNPPYGERLMNRNEIVKLYKSFSKTFSALKNWSLNLITPVSDFERLFGKRADKKRKIYNGKLECTYYQYYSKKP